MEGKEQSDHMIAKPKVAAGIAGREWGKTAKG